MANIRTDEEIRLQVEGLKRMKDRFPEFSKFGDKNWELIDAQIDVIQGLKNAEDFYVDETTEEFQDGDNDTYFEAVRAEDWLLGIVKEDIFSD